MREGHTLKNGLPNWDVLDPLIIAERKSGASTGFGKRECSPTEKKVTNGLPNKLGCRKAVRILASLTKASAP